MCESNNEKFAIRSSFKESLSFFMSIVAFLVLVFGFVEYRVDQKINDPNYIYKISSNVRPALIFDTNETILVDMGAGDLIESIKVDKPDPKENRYIITITPIRHFSFPPSIESVTDLRFVTKNKRGKGNEFIYDMILTQCNECDAVPQLKLEILKIH